MLKKQIILATKNPGKVREIKKILGSGVQGFSLLDLENVPRLIERGKTFQENAISKAKAIAQRFKRLTLADDSGLEVHALNGRPGVKSARFAGPNPTSEKLCRKLLALMKGKKDRRARFVCVVAMVWPGGRTKTVKGTVSGRIGERMRGGHGFGYDSVFVPDGCRKTFAQMSPVMKNCLSHRGRAFRKVRRLLSSL